MIKDIYNDYIKVTAADGYALTYYKDGDDILNYSSFKVVFGPINSNWDELREITIEEDKRYYDLQITAIKDLRG